MKTGNDILCDSNSRTGRHQMTDIFTLCVRLVLSGVCIHGKLAIFLMLFPAVTVTT